MHFVLESPRYRDRAMTLVQRGGRLAAFEEIIGPIEKVQNEWHAYVRHLKGVAAGTKMNFFKTGKVPEIANSIPF